MCSGAGMDAISFQVKRAHLCMGRACRWLISAVPDMTPERFHMLLLLMHAGVVRAGRSAGAKPGVNECFMRQEAIIRELGLHPSSVSEALGKLEKLGWIDRVRNYDDRRYNLVGLTALGYRRYRRAATLVFVRKLLKRPVDRLVRLIEPRRPFNEAFDKVWETINLIARYFGDSSTFQLYDRQSSYDMPRTLDPAGALREAIVQAHMTANLREEGVGPCVGVSRALRPLVLREWRLR